LTAHQKTCQYGVTELQSGDSGPFFSRGHQETFVILLQSVTLKELEDYKDAAMRVFDKNSDGRLSRRELGLLLSIDK